MREYWLQNIYGQVVYRDEYQQALRIRYQQILEEQAANNRLLQYDEDEDNYVEIKKSDNKMDMDISFVPMGFEYTYYLSKAETPEDVNSRTYDNLLEEYKEKIEKKIKNTCSYIYVDGPVVEICSPVHRSKADAVRFFERMNYHANNLKMRAKPEERASGGLHINCAIPSHNTIKGLSKTFAKKFMENLIFDMANRPYLNWIFNDPNDFDNAMCLWSHDDVGSFSHSSSRKRFNYTDVNDKDYAINVKKDHFEFRIFDMVESSYELCQLINFVNAYMRYIFKLTKAGKSVSKSPLITNTMLNKKVYAFREEVAISEFNKLLKKLKLEPSRYKRFVKNLNKRYEYTFSEITTDYLK